ncbi:RecA protein [hydrothermal vent metagenome]|uniref:RecA protein n=1 Tax=hydrothermal vent metagenome TaxID=652676 RepID=A0A1W1CKN4_9ZZZZ
MDANRKKALEMAMKQIDKNFGKGTIVRLGDKDIEPIESISTGSLGLDMALGIGGVPVGRVIEIYGPESSGKTTLALQITASAQAKDKICAFIDAEHALDILYAKNLGVDVENLLVSQPDFGEQALDVLETLARSGAVDVIVVDSVAALTPKAEIEGEMGDQQVGLQARLMSKALRKITAILHKTNTTVIFINQLRMKIGMMGYGCFHYDTLVNFADGRTLPIGEVVNNQIEGDVYSLNEKTGEIEIKPIVDWHDNGKVESSKEFIHIQTQSIDGRGRFGFTCTQNHEILTDTGWKKAEELSFEDRLVSRYTETVNGSYGEFLRGIFIGDSRIHIRDKNTANLKLQDNENSDYLNWKLDKLEKFLNFKEITINRGFRYDSEFTYEFAKIKRELGERNPLYMLENHYSDLSLAIWFMDDGNYDTANGHNRYSISIKRFKNQENLLNKIKDILIFKTGIKNIFINPKDGSINFTVQGTQQLAKIICKYIPKPMQYKLPKEFQNRYEDFTLSNTPNIKKDYVEIKEIREASNRQMRKKRKFDISVKDNKNYMVGGIRNGVVVHNSPEITTGGNALKFYASVRIDVRRIATLKQGDAQIGNRVKAKVIKNKVAPPFRQAEFDIMFGEGISMEGELVDYGVKLDIIDKSGAWFSYGEGKLGQGKENVKKRFKEDTKLRDEIEAKIKEALGITSMLTMDSKAIKDSEE